MFDINFKRLFLEGLIVELNLVHTSSLTALKNLMILKRTLPVLLPSFVVRLDKEDGKIVFDMSFLRKIKMPWLAGFSYKGVPTKEQI